MEKLATIYRITNKVNGATYIGQTTLSLQDRWLNHIKETEGNKQKLVYLAVKEYGELNFTIEKIDETFYRHRFIVEQHYIEKELQRNVICYNTNVKGLDFKQKMSIVTKGSKNGMYGKKGSEAINGQKVQMLNEEGKVIKEFNTVNLAKEYLNIKGHAALYKACRNKTKYKGYYWSKTSKQYI